MADVEGAAADAVRGHSPDALGDDLLLAPGDATLTPAIKAAVGLGGTEQPPVPRMKVSMRPIFISGLPRMPRPSVGTNGDCPILPRAEVPRISRQRHRTSRHCSLRRSAGERALVPSRCRHR